MNNKILNNIKLLNSFHIKMLAILFMTIDHIGYIFNQPEIYRIIGRLAFPLFAFLIYQGYTYTRDRTHYFLRLFLFGVILELSLMIIGQYVYLPPYTPRNIFLTLSFGVLGFMIIDSRYPIVLKPLAILYLAYIATVLNFDYTWYGVLLILSFRFFPRYFYVSILIQFILAYFDTRYNVYTLQLQYYALFAWVFIVLYNHKRGYAGLKYLFYIYYPLHLGVLYLIAMFI